MTYLNGITTNPKILTLLLVGALCLGLLAGCGGKSGDSGSAAPLAAPTASADPDVKRFDSCGRCVAQCPTRAIHLGFTKKPRRGLLAQ